MHILSQPSIYSNLDSTQDYGIGFRQSHYFLSAHASICWEKSPCKANKIHTEAAAQAFFTAAAFLPHAQAATGGDKLNY